MDSAKIIRTRSFARAGLAGNPSDGYFGKTLSFTLKDFYAEVVIYRSQGLELLPGSRDSSVYSDLSSMVQSINDHGYYGGLRLLQATLKRFTEHCAQHEISFSKANFTMRYFTNIPSRVGMAGSSAIIVSCLRALMQFYDVNIDQPELANLALSVETKELGIGAGLQDRVAQVYQGLTFMDFDRKLMESRGYGQYESLNTSLLVNIYLAYKVELSEGSERFHNHLRGRFDSGEPEVVSAMRTWAAIAEEVRSLLLAGKQHDIGHLLNANFDLRKSICRIHPDNIAMVDAARSVGASAKFTGSGGAIIGRYNNERMYQELKNILAPLGIIILKPELI
ncbi:GHMP kinase [Akkermansiaceae bacterium]|nr:GHMP kinase [Akkermansiaceae bacterium]